jgi:hypothetical protein
MRQSFANLSELLGKILFVDEPLIKLMEAHLWLAGVRKNWTFLTFGPLPVRSEFGLPMFVFDA